jgi:hypothetical protein
MTGRQGGQWHQCGGGNGDVPARSSMHGRLPNKLLSNLYSEAAAAWMQPTQK